MKTLILGLLVFLGSCSHYTRPKGLVNFYVGTSTEYDVKTNQVVREADVILETVMVNDMEEIHAWFYTGPGNGVKTTVFPSVSKRTENPLIYVMTNIDGSYLGRQVFESEKKDKWRSELYFADGRVNIVDYEIKNGDMEFTRNLSRTGLGPIVRVIGSLKPTNEADFKKRRDALLKAK